MQGGREVHVGSRVPVRTAVEGGARRPTDAWLRGVGGGGAAYRLPWIRAKVLQLARGSPRHDHKHLGRARVGPTAGICEGARFEGLAHRRVVLDARASPLALIFPGRRVVARVRGCVGAWVGRKGRVVGGVDEVEGRRWSMGHGHAHGHM